MPTPALMLQGTGSDVGKSMLVAGLARAFARRGRRVLPFKPQNMSNNAAVTADGGEIGRAQALQARAAGVAPCVDMNPVLLKPEGETGAQVVVQGRVRGRAGAGAYHAMKPTLLPAVLESFARLAAQADLVLCEGAGGAAEVNLRAGDIANMGFARAAGVPVVLVGDIERGGVIASLVGTARLLEPADRAHLRAYIVNKFRGDPALFAEGLAVITRETGLPAAGVVPWFAHAHALPAEDSLALERAAGRRPGAAIRIAVPRLPRVANADDLDPLRAEPDVALEVVPPGRALPGDADLVILPGSKATLADLAALRAEGWDIDLAAHVRRGGWVVGLCGGYQMLGTRIEDPDGVEGPPGAAAGLKLLAVETRIGPAKRLALVEGRDAASGAAVRGYEMHMGETHGPGRARPWLTVAGRGEGAVSADGRVRGGYLHGVFAADPFRHAFLGAIRTRATGGVAYEAGVEAALDALADHLEAHLDLDRLEAIARARA